MSNRMSVLSRRLERFAGIFSIATFASFLGAFFASAKAEGQLVYLCAGLAAVCLFAAFFLWVAHGFAWALIPEEPLVAKRPAEALKPAAAMRPAEEMKPAEIKPAEEKKPAEAIKPAPAAAMKPAETNRPAEEKKPSETMKAVEERKPAEEKAIAEEDPADAKYTITGKRIY